MVSNLIDEIKQTEKGWFLYEYEDEDIVDNETEESMKDLYSLLDSIQDTEECIFIDYIENISGVKGVAKEIVNYLKDKYNTIFLWSTSETEDYWANLEYENIIQSYFVWRKK